MRLLAAFLGLVGFVGVAWVSSADPALDPPPGVPSKPRITRSNKLLSPSERRIVGDSCDEPFTLPQPPCTVSDNTCGFSDDTDEACPFPGSTSPDVVYELTCLADDVVTIDLCQSTYDSKVYVYEDSCGSEHLIACNDDACLYQSLLDGVSLTGGRTYYIVIDGYDGDCGDYVMSVTPLQKPCCNGAECQLLSLQGCLDIGGEWLPTLESCEPNPCLDYACCVDSTCQVISALDCSALGGEWLVGITECEPYPCVETACCVGDSCAVLTFPECDTAGGVWTSELTCSPNPCRDYVCCIESMCQVLPSDSCATLGGDWLLGIEACDPDPCVHYACCTGSSCQVLRQDECLDIAGEWLEGLSDCSPNPCAPHACCTDETCQLLTRADCDEVGGEWHLGWTCDPDPCLSTACCTGESCYLLSRASCDSLGGTWRPDMTCDPNPCLDYACCVDQTCQLLSMEACASLGGDWLLGVASCLPNPCITHACCVGDICLVQREQPCEDMGGLWLQGSNSCDPNPCLFDFRVCCFAEECVLLPESECEFLDGVWIPSSQSCTPNPCVGLYLVKPDGTGDFPTIQAALDAAVNGDIIELADGTYTGNGNRNLDYHGKSIVLRSRNADPNNCVIDLQDNYRGFNFISGETPAAVLQGITIKDGYAVEGAAAFCNGTASPTFRNCIFLSNFTTTGSGPAAYCIENASPSFEDCIFSENSTRSFNYGDGGSIYLNNSCSAVLTRCSFIDNYADEGGAIQVLVSSSLRAVECVFAENHSHRNGGTVGFFDASSGEFINCTFRDNYTPYNYSGAALYLRGAGVSVSIERCTFVGNQTGGGNGTGAGIHVCQEASINVENAIIAFSGPGGAAGGDGTGDVTASCCDFYSNNGGDWIGDFAPFYGIDGNFSADPRFCNLMTRDLTLAAASPCAPDNQPQCGQIGALGVGCTSVKLYIRPNGSGDYPTIQAAINAASPGQIIELAPGTFAGSGNRDIDFLGKAITLRAQDGYAGLSIIDCQGSVSQPHRGLVFDSGETVQSIVEGITVIQGVHTLGGAVLCQGSSPMIKGCTFAANAATSGGAVYCDGASPTLINCTLAENSASIGGGIACVNGASPILENSIIAHGAEGEALNAGDGAPTLACCDLYGNAGGDWTAGIEDQLNESGNMSQNPRFCTEFNPDTPYTLHGDSPCASENNLDCGLVGSWDVACSENVVCVPDALELTVSIQSGVQTVRYLGGASGPVFGYEIEVVWDPALASATFLRPDTGPFANALTFFVVTLGPGHRKIISSLAGGQPGTNGPDDLCKITLSSLGVSGESIVDLSLIRFRDPDNNALTLLAEDDGELRVMLGPEITNVFIRNTTLDTNDFIKDGDGASVTARVVGTGSLTIEADLSGLGSGAAVTPDAFVDDVATWTVQSVTTDPMDGLVTVTVSAWDEALNPGMPRTDAIIADNTLPTPLTELTAAPGHMEVQLNWPNSYNHDAHFEGVMIRAVPWGDYPLYAAPEPDYPSSGTAGMGVYAGTGTSIVHTFTMPDRDIYYYGGFVYDRAGNVSVPGATARATNYWLGDVVPNQAWDGVVNTGDISLLGNQFYVVPLTSPQVDIAPTHNGSRTGIPEPDGIADFDDVMIFSMNFGIVSPKLAVPMAVASTQDSLVQSGMAGESDSVQSSVALQLHIPDDPSTEREFSVEVLLKDEGRRVKGIHFTVTYDTSTLTYLAASPGDLVSSCENAFFMPVIDGRFPTLHMVALGGGVTLGGSGQLARLSFRRSTDGPVSMELSEIVARDVDNRDLLGGPSDSDIADQVSQVLPTHIYLRAGHPNPTTGTTSIVFGVPRQATVHLAIFDVTGRLVRRLADGVLLPGEYRIPWDARTGDGSIVASGLYLCRLEALGKTVSSRVAVVR